MPVSRHSSRERPEDIFTAQSSPNVVVAEDVRSVVEIDEIESRSARIKRQRAEEQSDDDQQIEPINAARAFAPCRLGLCLYSNSIDHSLSFSSRYGLILSSPIRSCCIESRWR